jgi:hypothetical protein
MEPRRGETYLGDGVYCSFDGYQLWLRTADRAGTLQKVALEPNVYRALVRYAQDLGKRAASGRDLREEEL